MMTSAPSLLFCIDGCDALIDPERAINGFIATNHLIHDFSSSHYIHFALSVNTKEKEF